MSTKTKSGETPKQKGGELLKTWFPHEFLHINGKISQSRGISFIISFPNNILSFSQLHSLFHNKECMVQDDRKILNDDGEILKPIIGK
jgi:hypothetical protein